MWQGVEQQWWVGKAQHTNLQAQRAAEFGLPTTIWPISSNTSIHLSASSDFVELHPHGKFEAMLRFTLVILLARAATERATAHQSSMYSLQVTTSSGLINGFINSPFPDVRQFLGIICSYFCIPFQRIYDHGRYPAGWVSEYISRFWAATDIWNCWWISWSFLDLWGFSQHNAAGSLAWLFEGSPPWAQDCWLESISRGKGCPHWRYGDASESKRCLRNRWYMWWFAKSRCLTILVINDSPSNFWPGGKKEFSSWEKPDSSENIGKCRKARRAESNEKTEEENIMAQNEENRFIIHLYEWRVWRHSIKFGLTSSQIPQPSLTRRKCCWWSGSPLRPGYHSISFYSYFSQIYTTVVSMV